jgi:DNA-binding transcriptional LysR family regulator
MVHTEDPTVHQLRLLLTLAEELHFKHAADRLYLTQPALSQQIRSLEHRLGVQLFVRTSRRVELTSTGQVLLPLAKKIVDATDDLRGAARRATHRSDQLRIGVSENAAALAATRAVLAMISALHPGIDVAVRVVDFIEQTTVLRDGDVDAAFVYLPVPDGVCFQALTTEPRVVCVSSADPLARRSSVRLADLADHPVVSLSTEVFQSGRDFWAVDPRPDGTPVRYTDHHVSRCETLLSAVSFDEAIAFVPAVMQQLYPRPDVHYLPTDDLSPCSFAAVWLESDHQRSQILVLEDVCQRLRQQGLPSPGAMPDPVRLRRPVRSFSAFPQPSRPGP